MSGWRGPEELAARRQISQSNVSRLEKRRDTLMSTVVLQSLSEVIGAFGGVLPLVVWFPEGSIAMKQFDNGEAG